MTHRIFVSYTSQGDASAAYVFFFFTATLKKTTQTKEAMQHKHTL